MNNKQKDVGVLKSTPTYLIICLILFSLLVFSVLISVTMGSVEISVKDIYKVILYKAFSLGNASALPSDSIIDIVWFIRLPRIVLAIGVGMGLSVSGVVMQAIVKNPLADPFILGVSSGASLGATLAIMLGVGISLGANYVGISAFIGAFVVSLLVISMSNLKGRSNSTKLLLSGMALSTLSSSFSSFIIYFSKNTEGIKDITYWLMGSLAGASWENIRLVLPVVVISTIFFISQYRTLNLMLLGDDVSITLGKDLHKYRVFYLLISSLMVGLIVYSSGIIGFVGLIIPHIVRMIFGTDHKKTILIIALTGAIFLIWTDVCSRIVVPGSELPIGILISVIGAPVFIYLMISKSYGFGGES